MTAVATLPIELQAATKRPRFGVKLLSPLAKVPVKGTAGAAGFDVFSVADVVIPARGKNLVPLGIATSLPPGTYLRVAARSGLAHKHSLDVGAGVIDEDYGAEIGVILFNHSDVDYPVQTGHRVAQVILEKYERDAEVIVLDEIEQTERGSGGFGSTGLGEIEGPATKKVKN
jgi:dUTP pyrophosphatase